MALARYTTGASRDFVLLEMWFFLHSSKVNKQFRLKHPGKGATGSRTNVHLW